MEGGMEGGREGGMDGGMEGWREGWREGGREGKRCLCGAIRLTPCPPSFLPSLPPSLRRHSPHPSLPPRGLHAHPPFLPERRRGLGHLRKQPGLGMVRTPQPLGGGEGWREGGKEGRREGEAGRQSKGSSASTHPISRPTHEPPSTPSSLPPFAGVWGHNDRLLVRGAHLRRYGRHAQV